MTTYNTYQKAKIANPECEIYIRTGEFWPEKSIAPSPRTYESRGFELCNPTEYCMTVERFLADGHRFVEGDLILDGGSVYLVADCKTQNYWYETESANKPDCDDDRRHTLRAAALEEKKPRIKVEYEKVGFHKCHEAMFEHEMEGVLYGLICNEFKKATLTYISNNWKSDLYRRIETPMTEREAFIEAASEALPSFDKKTAPIWAGKLYDSGMFKLVK